MKKSILLFLLAIIIFASEAQPPRAYNWAMGNNKSLSFPLGASPGGVGGSSNGALEGGGVISDLSGNLLFYTDGDLVWDAGGVQRLNLFPALDPVGIHCQQGLVIPNPANASQYIIFSTTNTKFIHYTVINPSTWTVISGPNSLLPGVTMNETMAAVRKSNGTDYWVATHEELTPNYRIINIRDNSGSLSVTVSGQQNPAGNLQPGGNFIQGQMKFSIDGAQLAMSANNFPEMYLEVYAFDKGTGVIGARTRQFLPNLSLPPQGIEFSPDGALIYAEGFGNLYQCEISSGNVFNMGNCNASSTSMQIGADCDIYYMRRASNRIGRIADPNVVGAGCNNNLNYLASAGLYYGLPSIVASDLQSVCNPLPFEMIQFGAKVSNNAWVDVFWSTTSDKETDHYVVERSFNGKDFNFLGKVDGKMMDGNAHYDFKDSNLKVGKTYYRIRAVDLKGEYRYSKIAMINYEKIDIISVFPNPVMHQLHLKYESDVEDLGVNIYNATGEMVYTHEISVFDQGNVTIDVDQFPAGVYFVSVKDFLTGYEVKQNFVKQ